LPGYHHPTKGGVSQFKRRSRELCRTGGRTQERGPRMEKLELGLHHRKGLAADHTRRRGSSSVGKQARILTRGHGQKSHLRERCCNDLQEEGEEGFLWERTRESQANQVSGFQKKKCHSPEMVSTIRRRGPNVKEQGGRKFSLSKTVNKKKLSLKKNKGHGKV